MCDSPGSTASCPNGLPCRSDCQTCGFCGDGIVGPDEVCEPPGLMGGCPPGLSCVGCSECGVLLSREEDITPCVPSRVDRWRFDVNAGDIVQVRVDTIDADTAALLSVRIDCTNGQSASAMRNVPCSFVPGPASCPQTQFLALSDTSCDARVEVVCCFDPPFPPVICGSPATARYRIDVTGSGLVLVP